MAGLLPLDRVQEDSDTVHQGVLGALEPVIIVVSVIVPIVIIVAIVKRRDYRMHQKFNQSRHR